MHHLLYLTITIVSASYASPTSPTESSQLHPCNSCCQGPSGLPGTPGTSGHYGLPGRDGLRGDKGDIGSIGLNGGKGDVGNSGLRGEKGLVGPQGLNGGKGDQGLRGLPGKVGPQGLKGLTGLAGVDGHGLSGKIGQKGEIGQQGELGQKGESGERMGRSAFTAVKTGSQTGSRNDVLTFQKTLTNVGNNFNVGTSRFTCQIPGVYWFTFTMCRHSSGDPQVFLVKDGTSYVIARFYDSANPNVITQLTNGAVLELAAGEQVWIKFSSSTRQQVFSNGNHFTSFSGFLLHEI